MSDLQFVLLITFLTWLFFGGLYVFDHRKGYAVSCFGLITNCLLVALLNGFIYGLVWLIT